MHATGVKPPRVCSVQVLLWDMRKPAAPFRTILPDGSPALQLLASPETEKCMAVATGVWVPQVCGCHRCATGVWVPQVCGCHRCVGATGVWMCLLGMRCASVGRRVSLSSASAGVTPCITSADVRCQGQCCLILDSCSPLHPQPEFFCLACG